MKLEPRPRYKREKAGEILRVEERRTGSEIFDPRFDLPKGETQRLLAMVESGERPANTVRDFAKLDGLVWLSWVDPKYGRQLRQFIHYHQYLYEIINKRNWEEILDPPFGAIHRLDSLLQISPNLRERFTSVLNSERIFSFYRGKYDCLYEETNDEGIPMGFLESNAYTTHMYRLLILIRLWPEKRKELMDQYNTLEQQELLLSKLDIEKGNRERLVFAARLVLLLPNLRPVILQKVHKELNGWRSEIALAQQIEMGNTGFERLQNLLSSLAILFAENAYIDDRGVVKLELSPVSAGELVPLPDRLTA